ncbi:hypothetical protein [Lysinibacillus fusiformis]|uniref:hypothetical protein n=1 Tax=Lysinibacillus fusiformis TaxID=28031 RepID=UPI0020C0FE73|nr:hypothetical protein [Lysinibacillus fusiformis]
MYSITTQLLSIPTTYRWTADNLDHVFLIVQLVGFSVATIFIYKLAITWLEHRR